MKLKRKPSKACYILGVFLIIIGITFFVSQVVMVVTNLMDTHNLMVAPGNLEIIAEESGVYTIFYEYRSTIDDKLYSTSNSNISGLKINVTDISNNQEIEIERASINTTYSLNGREGVSIFEFKIEEPCKLLIEAEYEKTKGDDVVLNITKNKVSETMIQVIKIIIITLTIVLCGALVLIITSIKRNKYNKINKKINLEKR